MKLKYVVLSKDPGVLIKFFYEEDGKYGEFKIELKRETFDLKRPEDTIGVRGDAEVWTNDPDSGLIVSEAFAKAMQVKPMQVKAKTNLCPLCKNEITGGYIEDDLGNEGEIEKGHNEDCPVMQK